MSILSCDLLVHVVRVVVNGSQGLDQKLIAGMPMTSRERNYVERLVVDFPGNPEPGTGKLEAWSQERAESLDKIPCWARGIFRHRVRPGMSDTLQGDFRKTPRT